MFVQQSATITQNELDRFARKDQHQTSQPWFEMTRASLPPRTMGRASLPPKMVTRTSFAILGGREIGHQPDGEKDPIRIADTASSTTSILFYLKAIYVFGVGVTATRDRRREAKK